LDIETGSLGSGRVIGLLASWTRWVAVSTHEPDAVLLALADSLGAVLLLGPGAALASDVAAALGAVVPVLLHAAAAIAMAAPTARNLAERNLDITSCLLHMRRA